ncbi:MAG: bifunctional nuclease family protein [Anaerolineales bacterium]
MMVEVVIDSVRVSLMSAQRLIVLRQVNTERFLPIWVGPYEAEAITVALQEIEMMRPLTHDLLKNVFTTFGAAIKRVEIVALREEVFYGNIVVETRDGQTINIDSRPSDAIAIAVRAHVPIMVDPTVMVEAGITPEQNIESQTTAAPPAPLAPRPAVSQPQPPPINEDRLSIFEDFLSSLNKPKPDKKEDDAGEDPKPGQD